MIYRIQKIIVGALPLALSIIGLQWAVGRVPLSLAIFRGTLFVLASYLTGHLMTIWTEFYRSYKHGSKTL